MKSPDEKNELGSDADTASERSLWGDLESLDGETGSEASYGGDIPAQEQNSLSQYFSNIAIGLIAIHFSLNDTNARLKSLAKLMSLSSVHLQTLFVRAICRGFEKTSEKIRGDDDRAEQLADIQKEVSEELFNIDLHQKRITQAFQDAYKMQNKTFEMIDKHLKHTVASGDDFLWNPNNLPGAFSRRTKTVFMQDDNLFKKMTYLPVEDLQKNFAAATSAFLMQVDCFGELLGKELTVISVKLAGVTTPKIFAKYITPSVLTATFLYQEINEMISEVTLKSTGVLYDAFFYPVVSGVAIGLYEELEKMLPDMLPPFPKEGCSSSDEFSSAFDFKKAYSIAKKYHEKYDGFMGHNNVVSLGLAKNPSSSKKLLDARGTFFMLFDKNRYTQLLKEGFQGVRPLASALKNFSIKLSYLTSKTLTKTTVGTVKYLTKSLMGAISSDSSRGEDGHMQSSPHDKLKMD